MTGHITVKLLALAILPLVHVVYFEGDAAKPGLEYVIAMCEFAFLVVGFVTGSLLVRARNRAQSRQVQCDPWQ